ncbi:hypothetical protein KUTeg_002643 [Tegillarca granosa]|uniref:Transporter n=1 Tax=Tegillarca granosa TaxID=220873 RepID=A0ABQ9FY62_TEGGR|nr:hypothetical protein KUTeg_002643 [Tegillarca granosa]
MPLLFSLQMMAVYKNQKEDILKTQEKIPYVKERDTWGKKIDFIFSTVGCAVGLGNIWRFPYLCYKHGGGTFLVTYLVSLICGGVPMFILEIALGQYMRKGGLSAWDICPLFKGAFFVINYIISMIILIENVCGIGVATMVVVFLMNIYYVMILCWSVFYFVMSFKSRLPWSHCDNYWNTDSLFSKQMQNSENDDMLQYINGQSNLYLDKYYERRVIQISDGIDVPGHVVWELALCLLFAWIVVYLCVCKGIRWTGKIVYFTALFPYVILTILLIRGATLEGAAYGIEYYLKPNFTKLTEPQVWVDGGTQIFFSYAIALGVMITLGSYNKFNHNFYRDCFIIMGVNSGTSFYGGFAVFSVLGFMATKQGVHISEVVESVGLDSQGGIYVFQLFDYYSASGMVLLWLLFWESIGILLFQIVKFVPLKYNDIYTYPTWAQVFGICMALASILILQTPIDLILQTPIDVIKS